MVSKAESLLVAEVQLRERGGSIHAYSDEIPGLNICGTDRQEVLEDVIAGIKFLYQELKGIAVEVKWVDSPAAMFDARLHTKDVARFMMMPTFARAQ